MRRRVWCSVIQLDSISSLLVSLPGMIRAGDHDTAEPRNVHDWELTKDMTNLPPSRSLSHETPMAYLITKGRILRALRGILDSLSSLRPDSYDFVLNLEEELSWAHLQVPPHLQLSFSVNSADDHPSLISRRVQLDFLYHQGMCLLHRKFFAQGRFDTRLSHSRRRCIESAVALLSLQEMLHREAKTRGSVRASHWFRIPVASHDFILAAMILCLELRKKSEEAPNHDTLSWTRDTQQNVMLQGLETSCNIWKEIQIGSLEAWKVHRVLSSTLEILGVGEKVGSLRPGGMPISSSEQIMSPLDGEILPPAGDIDWVSWHTR
jgi:hypothetical protein